MVRGQGSYLWRRFFRNRSGNVAMMASMAAPVLMAAMGAASDYANFNLKHDSLQAAADAAAIAAATELSVASSSNTSINASAGVFVRATLGAEADATEVQVDIDRLRQEVTVTLTEVWTPFFAHFLSTDMTPIIVGATATLSGASSVCVLALDPSGADAINADKTSQVQANGCGVYSNSTSAASIRLRQSAKIAAELTCTSGGIGDYGGGIAPEALTDYPSIADPLAARPEPKVNGCDFTDVSYSSGTVTLDPGVYCGGLKISGKTHATLSPGLYVIEGDRFDLGGSASLTGNDVSIYLKGDKAEINFNGNTTVSLSGQTSGGLAGLLFFEDRAAPLNRVHRISSADTKELTGTIYLPRGQLRIDAGKNVAEESAYTAIVARSLQINNGPKLILNSNYGSTDVPVPEGIRSAAQVVLSN